MRISSRTAAATAKEYRDLLEILDDPGGRGSILITSQLPAGQWHELELGSSVSSGSTPIGDRLCSHRLDRGLV